jgi:hypothetical protein
MPPPGGSQASDSREIGMIGNSPKLHIARSGENSVINPLKHFTDDGGAEFIL